MNDNHEKYSLSEKHVEMKGEIMKENDVKSTESKGDVVKEKHREMENTSTEKEGYYERLRADAIDKRICLEPLSEIRGKITLHCGQWIVQYEINLEDLLSLLQRFVENDPEVANLELEVDSPLWLAALIICFIRTDFLVDPSVAPLMRELFK